MESASIDSVKHTFDTKWSIKICFRTYNIWLVIQVKDEKSNFVGLNRNPRSRKPTEILLRPDDRIQSNLSTGFLAWGFRFKPTEVDFSSSTWVIIYTQADIKRLKCCFKAFWWKNEEKSALWRVYMLNKKSKLVVTGLSLYRLVLTHSSHKNLLKLRVLTCLCL